MEDLINPEKNDLLLSKNIFSVQSLKDLSNPSHIPYKDKLYLTPTEKYRIYGKFPLRLLLDIALAILSTIQITMISGPTTEYTKAVERFFYDTFLQNDNIHDKEVTRIKYIYTMDDLEDFVRESRDSFYELRDKSLGNLTFHETDEEFNNILLSIDYINKKDENELMEEYNMTKDDAWIFNETYDKFQRKKILNGIKSFLIEYKVNTFEPYNFGDYYECFQWDVKQIFDFEKRYHFSITLDISFSSCEDLTKNGNSFIKGSYWIPSFIILFSLIDFLLTIRSLIIGYKYFLSFQYKYSKEKIKIERENKPPKIKTKWEMLRKKDKKNFVSRLNYLQAIVNIVQFLGSILTVYEGKEVIVVTKYIVGIAAALSYLNLMKYLRFYSNFQTVINTILKSIPYLILYFIGTMPIFLSFVVFAVANFPYSERFYSFTRVILNLFGMMNGDSILDIINDIIENSFLLGHIYIYLFLILFICFVINIFVSIIEDSFVSSKIKNQNHWIYSFVKKNQNKNEEKGNISRKEMRLYDEMRRKSLIRNVLRKSSKKINEKIDKEKLIQNDKGQLNLNESIKDFDKSFNKIKDEINNITNEIKESKDCKMKYELKQFILKRISNLQKLISEEKKTL